MVVCAWVELCEPPLCIVVVEAGIPMMCQYCAREGQESSPCGDCSECLRRADRKSETWRDSHRENGTEPPPNWKPPKE